LAEATGAPATLRVIAPGSHDTASAVAAVPATGQGGDDSIWAYLSSGTWSLLGAELDRPNVAPEACAVPFTNERGVDNTIRFLKNIGGLWLVQELRRELASRGEKYEFAAMVREAESAEPFRALVDPNDARFAAPGDMSIRLQQFASETGQPEPTTVGQLVRCCLESLALCYRGTIDQLERVVGKQVSALHIVGGGCQNVLLNEMTAAAVGRPVLVGPIEATATGNLLVQAIGCGQVGGLAELRQIVARSFPITPSRSRRSMWPCRTGSW
jgi:rhamnulokinase